MVFIPDKKTSTFIPDKPRSTFMPDKPTSTFVADRPEKPTIASRIFKGITDLPDPLMLRKTLPPALEAEEKVVKWGQRKLDPATKTESALKNFMALMGQEAISMYRPSRIAMAQLAGPVIGQLGKGISKVVPKIAKKGFVYRYGQPETYQRAAEKATLKRAFGAEEAKKVSEVLSKAPSGKPLTTPEQRYVGRLFRKEVAVTPRLEAKPKFQELSSIAKEGREIMDKWSKALIESGIPSKQATRTIERNVGRYMPRMFAPRLAEKGIGQIPAKPTRLKLAGLKHRKDLSEQVLKRLGEIKEPALPTAIRVKELSTTTANAELFNTVSKNPEWSSPMNITGRMVKMPNTPNLGGLKNKFVIPEIADDINGIIQSRSEALKIYDKALSAWKFGKVVLNPATHARNIMSNTMLLDMSGVNHFKQMRLLPQVAKDYISKGKFYKEAKGSGLLGTEFYSVEMSDFLKSYNLSPEKTFVSKVMDVIKYPFKKAGETYQTEEQLAKMIKFTDMRMKGAGIEAAKNEAEKWIFNYQKIPKFIEFLRRSPLGAPFITFTYKALPRIAETAVNNPLKLYKYHVLFNAFNNASTKTLGLTPEEMAKEKKYMPEYLKTKIPGMPTQLLLPTRDEHGRTQYLNLEYILPVGMAPEIAEKGLVKGFISNPFFNILSELKANRDFRDKEIVNKDLPVKERYLKMAEYIYRQAMPSFAPHIGRMKGGYSWEKLKASLQKVGDYAGRVRKPQQVLLDIFAGLKIQPIDVKEGIRFEAYEKQRDVQKQMQQIRKTIIHKGISPKEKERVKKEGMKTIQRIIGR